jgi:hypothetical protein
MRTLPTAFALAGFLGLTAAPAMAQDGTRPTPRVELGANATVLSDFGFLGGPQVTVNFNPRHAVQATADLTVDRGSSWWNTDVIYTIQYRYTLPLSTATTRIFVTAGGVGTLGWYHDDGFTYTTSPSSYTDWNGQRVTVPATTYSYPARTYFNGQAPVYPTAGLGIQHAIGKRIAVRGDISIVVAGSDELWLGVRAGGGVVIPLGRAK